MPRNFPEMSNVVVAFFGLMTALCAVASFAATDPFPDVARSYLVQVDGATVWEHVAGDRVPPASLTKLMTALLVDEAARPDERVTISARAAGETGARLGLKAGDSFRVRDLMAAAMIASANDACRALAEWNGGTESAFVQRMNRKAEALGLRDTRFANACGHDATGHYSTARDLAKLADAAMARPAIADLARRIDLTISTAEGSRSFRLVNRNALIGRYDGAIGVKSGFTAKAGKCVIALADRGGVRVLLVMLGGRDRWWDAHAILDQAFAHAADGR